jgi:hypothetical protein
MRGIGFHVSQIRMEEEESAGPYFPRRELGPRSPAREARAREESEEEPPELPVAQLLIELVAERRSILENEKLQTKDKIRLLESNRRALVIATGGKTSKTENVVYGILVFGAVVLVILALLTTYAHLPSDITLAFVGTVLGGTIATIAQKLGKIGKI